MDKSVKQLSEAERVKLEELETVMQLASADLEEAQVKNQSAVVALRSRLKRALISLGAPLDSSVCIRCGRVSAAPVPDAPKQRCPCRE